MQYGFIIDNRKCIGCHACTVACKSEHDVAIGVNRTYVKQTEKGTFPDTRRVFSVMRCNHCSDAPCTTICPTSALFTREDGIVDFDNNRCIGCKSCMQACPYDALYIDPNTNTAAKCNYCAHRIDIGLQPACVNVCPEEAIVSGDMKNPETKIAQLLSQEQLTVRKPEKDTKPNVYYINGDEASLNPSATERSDNYIWSSQSTGVGHFSKFAEALASGKDLIDMAKNNGERTPKEAEMTYANKTESETPKKSVSVLMENAKAKRVYDTPDKGVLWGWEVSAYVWTKAIAAGLLIVPFIGWASGMSLVQDDMWMELAITALVFLGLTTVFLVKDLDQPKRFLYVMLRPHFKSWLVRGGYSLVGFGGLVTLMIVSYLMNWSVIAKWSYFIATATAVVVAVYTAFLFAQAKGRDFWQSPSLALHMFIHSIMAGAAAISLLGMAFGQFDHSAFLTVTMIGSLIVNLIVMLVEFMTTHPTADAKRVADMILKGRYKVKFWLGTVLVGNIIPLAICLLFGGTYLPVAALFVLFGIYVTEHIWIDAPQRLPLT